MIYHILMNGFKEARAVYHEKFQKQVPNKTLKELNWDMVEHNTLLQQSQVLCEAVKKILESAIKKRTAASHVLDTMLSDESNINIFYILTRFYIAC